MIKRFFTQNWHIKILALAAATAFWFFVLSSENTFFEFPDAITIEAFNVPEGLAVVNELGTANLTIRADQEIYKTLTPDNFTVYVDLQGLAAGSKRVDVSVNSKKTEVSVVNIDPENIQVTLEELTSTTLALDTGLEGNPESNYRAALAPSDDAVITVSGAESVLETITSIEAIITLQGDEVTDATQTVEIMAMDENGKPISNLTLEPNTIELTAIITPEEAQKTVGIKVNVESGGWIQDVNVWPQVVLIEGDAELLETIDYLETELVEIPEWHTFYDGEIDLIIPEGVSLAEDEPSRVDVYVQSVDDEV